MEESELTPEKEAELDALAAEFERQIERVAVDLQAAFPQMREFAPPVERRITDDEFEVSLTIDVSGIVETLRGLPDGAGTAAFVAAYNARQRDVRPPTG